MDVQVPVKSGKTVHVNKNYAIELKSQNFAIKVKKHQNYQDPVFIPVKKGKNCMRIHY